MHHLTHRFHRIGTSLLIVAILLISTTPVAPAAPNEPVAPVKPATPVAPTQPVLQAQKIRDMPPVPAHVFNGDLRDLPQEASTGIGIPSRNVPKTYRSGATPANSPAQPGALPAVIPTPLSVFPGLNFIDDGDGIPPDTNGAAGPTKYIQTVNTAIGIFDKATGVANVRMSFNTFFNGTGTPCDNTNMGDPTVLYDEIANRWFLADLAFTSDIAPPWYLCLAVSQTGDPIAGGWYQYAYLWPDLYFPDYPKFGLWPDGYYLTVRGFDTVGSGYSTEMHALNRTAMLAGAPLTAQGFHISPDNIILETLPATMQGPLPPAGAPEYFLGTDLDPAYSNILATWKFHVDWTTPANTTLTGPGFVTVNSWTDQCYGAMDCIPQLGSTAGLDSFSGHLMAQLQYRNFGSYQALWANHTVSDQGIAAIGWYELRENGTLTPTLYQEGTFSPGDGIHRWMGSLAIDQDSNMAVGYSGSNASMYPDIRYAGRLAGEAPGVLGQGEAIMASGGGSQTEYNRWGDYTAMVLDPTDDCTFWYTNEIYTHTASFEWDTRIGSFKFPSCGMPKGYLAGLVTNAVTNAPIANVPVYATNGSNSSFTAITDGTGHYTMAIIPGTYNVTGGPLLPSYPTPYTATGLNVTVATTTTKNMSLVPVPYPIGDLVSVDDSSSTNNGDGYPDPGETSIRLYQDLQNIGAVTATNVVGHLSSADVPVVRANAAYPNIPVGSTATNTANPYLFSVPTSTGCGAVLHFQNVVTATPTTLANPFRVVVGTPGNVVNLFSDNVESGVGSWTTGGTQNTWAIAADLAHSPTHAWTDSPSGPYVDNTNSWLKSPTFDFTNKTEIQLSAWITYDLELHYDYLYVEYSTNGGTTWAVDSMGSFTGISDSYGQYSFTAPRSRLDDQPSVAFRFRMASDGGVVTEGVHIDDISVSYRTYTCARPTSYGTYFPLAVYNGAP